MSDESLPNPSPKINLYNVAADDALWVLETDHAELLDVLADPAGWVSQYVKFGDEPAIVIQPFVVVFHEVPGSVLPASDATGGTAKPYIHVQGIHKTPVIRVRYSTLAEAPPSQGALFPEGEPLEVLRVGNVIHTHLHFTNFTPLQVANTIFTSVSSPSVFIDAMNSLPQTISGSPVPDDKKLLFVLDPALPPNVVYQGEIPTAKAVDSAHDPASPQPVQNCAMVMGDANELGQVIVYGVIIKTYTI